MTAARRADRHTLTGLGLAHVLLHDHHVARTARTGRLGGSTGIELNGLGAGSEVNDHLRRTASHARARTALLGDNNALARARLAHVLTDVDLTTTAARLARHAVFAAGRERRLGTAVHAVHGHTTTGRKLGNLATGHTARRATARARNAVLLAATTRLVRRHPLHVALGASSTSLGTTGTAIQVATLQSRNDIKNGIHFFCLLPWVFKVEKNLLTTIAKMVPVHDHVYEYKLAKLGQLIQKRVKEDIDDLDARVVDLQRKHERVESQFGCSWLFTLAACVLSVGTFLYVNVS